MAGYLGSVPVPQATQHRESFTCTEGQTTFNTAGYTPQFVDVYLNGSHLSPADFTASNGSDVVLGVAASADDVCDIISYTPFEIADQTFTGNTTMSTTDNSTNLLLTSTDATANNGPNVRFYRNSATPADDDLVGGIVFDSRNDNSQDIQPVRIRAYTPDVSDGTEDGAFDIATMTNGALSNRMDFLPTETIFNNSSIDVDFRVESNGNANMLFVDGGNNGVSIGTATVDGGPLTVQTGNTHPTAATFQSTGTTQLFLKDTDAGSNNKYWGFQVSGGSLNIITCDDNRAGGFVTPLELTQTDVKLGTGADFITNTAATSSLRIGVNAGNSINSDGDYNTFLGDEAGTATTSGNTNVGVGFNALLSSVAGDSQVAVGTNALATHNADGASFNVAVGHNSLNQLTTAGAVTAIGGESGLFCSTGQSGTFVGFRAGKGISGTPLTGANNTAVGRDAGLLLQGVAQGNTFVGRSAGAATLAAADNSAFGFEALLTETGGQNSVAIGPRALRVQVNNSGNIFNTGVGSNAGVAITQGHSNTIIGGQSGATLTTGDSNVCVGVSSNVDTADRNSAVALGAGIGTFAADSSFRVQGGGGVYNTGNTSAWNQTSDRRIKKNIADSTIGLAEINQIKVRTFEYRTADEITDSALQSYDLQDLAVNRTGTQIGCIAQELATIIPSAVIEDDRGVKVVQPDELNWHMIKAIQEQNALIVALTARIVTLEG